MPFVIKKFHLQEKKKAFLFLMRELGLSQSEAQKFIARKRVFANGELVEKDKDEISGDIEFITFEPITLCTKKSVETDPSIFASS